MIRIAAILYAIVATTMAGAGVIAVLSAGYTALVPILVAAGCGAVLAAPVSLLLARKIVG
ncbi:CTP synthetase [Roseobacter sp. YSTF-M11]|uniref:CTP synthetase n=1 Tax=Roseobacter insulae TaxID=2859783 RepID=A0A9X1FT90_9RHOB|nr:CTP synthetase [Roseobacter insulae]MBW4707126.1 CTP synthetase [Roseobacter insulae]